MLEPSTSSPVNPRTTKTPNTHAGQYAVPFKLYIEAQSCVPASLTP